MRINEFLYLIWQFSVVCRQRQSSLCLLGSLSIAFMLGSGLTAAENEPVSSKTHPLMPGIRSPDLCAIDWPRAMHDKLATGFSPLTCGMSVAPVVWSEIDLPGELKWARVITDDQHPDRLLLSDSQLRMFRCDGELLWSQSNARTVVYCGHLTGTDQEFLLLTSGSNLILRDSSTGEEVWSHSFEPNFANLRVQVADILPEKPGLEAAVILNHAEDGALVSFPPEGDPKVLWNKQAVAEKNEFQERADHLSDIELDLSDPAKPIIWNIRHHRCNCIDARTGEILSSVEYEIEGRQRRNYGPRSLTTDTNGNPLALITSEGVQTHVHAIRLHRDQPSEGAWVHNYGEVYKETPGVALRFLRFVDIDNNGVLDICYTVRDPERDYRSFVRVRDGETGSIICELADRWGAALLPGQGDTHVLLAFQARDGATPTQGRLELYSLGSNSRPRKLRSFSNAKPLFSKRAEIGQSVLTELYPDDPHTLDSANVYPDASDAPQIILRQQKEDGSAVINVYDFANGKVRKIEDYDAAAIVDNKLVAILESSDESKTFVVDNQRGTIDFVKPDGSLLSSHVLQGSAPPLITAADMDNDGRADILYVPPSGGLYIDSFDNEGTPHHIATYPYLHKGFDRGPMVYDLLSDGSKEVITIGSSPEGLLEISAQALDEPPLWMCQLDLYADELTYCTINPGQFLAGNRAGIAVSVSDAALIREGTYLIDGKTGKIRWFKSRYRDGYVIMPYRPQGIPTAFDFDRDGIDEIGMDLLSYMAYLRGKDGSFAFVRPTKNISAEGNIANGHLYNTYCPIFAASGDSHPHWMVIGGFGPFGMMKPDPRENLWSENFLQDSPVNIGMIDVDGDDSLDAGYAPISSKRFVCRDIWSGAIKWEAKLPRSPNSPTITADFDGDGKGEFLTGAFCIGTDSAGIGEIRWQAPYPIGWGLVADFDGDGIGEIACQLSGKIVILRGEE